jgi:hypothetical protein
MSAIPEDLRIYFHWVGYGTPKHREEATQAIQARGEEVIPWLIAMIREERQDYSQEGDNLTPLCWLVRLLASYGSPLATDTLFDVACIQVRDSNFPGMIAFREHLALLQKLSDSIAIPALIAALAKLQGRYGFLPDALYIARFLVAKAERAPCSELYPALPLLRPRFGSPRLCRELHTRLKAALGEGDLPIPATAKQATHDLPIPVEENSLAE